MVILDAVRVLGCACMHVCVCIAGSVLCFGFPADQAAVPARGQHRRLEAPLGTAQPSVVPGSPSPRHLRLQPLGKSLFPLLLLFGLSAKQRAPWALASSASMASSLLQELGWIPLSCPCAPSQRSDGGMPLREGSQGKQGVTRVGSRGSNAVLWALPQRLGLLSFHPSLVPACTSVTSGNFHWVCLCRGWPHPSPGPRCTLAWAAAAAGETLTTLQAAKESPLRLGTGPRSSCLARKTQPAHGREEKH